MVWLSLQATIVRLEQEALRRRERLLQHRQEEECKEEEGEGGEDDDDDEDDDCGNSSSESDEEEEEEEFRIFDDDDNSSERRRRQFRPLQNLHVRENNSLGLGLQGAKVLSEALQRYASDEKSKTTLRRLSLYSNNLGNAGLWQLRPALYQLQSSLVDLNLRSNNITAEGATVLSGLIKLQRLDLGYNQLGDEGVEALQLHRNSRLKSLYLFSNGISKRGAATILSLKTRLREVLLQGNAIGSSSEQGDFQLLENNLCSPKLRALYLDDNGISARQAQSLMQQLQHLRLDILSLRDNAIEEAEVLKASMITSPQVRFLDMEGNGKRDAVIKTNVKFVVDKEDQDQVPDPPDPSASNPLSPPRSSLVRVDWGSSSPTATVRRDASNRKSLEQLERGVTSSPPHSPLRQDARAVDPDDRTTPKDAVGQLMQSLMNIIPREDFDLLRWSSHENESSEEEELTDPPSEPDASPDEAMKTESLFCRPSPPNEPESPPVLDKHELAEDTCQEPPEPPDIARHKASHVMESRNLSIVSDSRVETRTAPWSSAEVPQPLQQPLKRMENPAKNDPKSSEGNDGDYHFATDDEASFCAAVEEELQQMEHSLDTKVPSSPLLAKSSSSSFAVVQELQHLLWKPLGLLAHDNDREEVAVVPELVMAEEDSGGAIDDSGRGEGNGSSSSVSSSSSSNNSLRSALDEYLRKVVSLGWESMELGVDDEEGDDDADTDEHDNEHESSSVGAVLPETPETTVEKKKHRCGRGRYPKAVARRFARFLYGMVQHRRKKKKEKEKVEEVKSRTAEEDVREQDDDVDTQVTTALKTSSLSLWSSSSSLARHSASSLNLLASAKSADVLPTAIEEHAEEAQDEEVKAGLLTTTTHKPTWKTTQAALSSVYQAAAHAGGSSHWASRLFTTPTQ